MIAVEYKIYIVFTGPPSQDVLIVVVIEVVTRIDKKRTKQIPRFDVLLIEMMRGECCDTF